MSAWEEYKKKHTLNSRTKTSPWEEYKNSRTVKSSLSVGSDAQSKSDPEDYETKKIELKAAADAEQAQVLSPDNLLLKSFVTHGSPSTITQGMQGIFQYIDWLKQSPEWLKYNQYTAAEQEEEKKAELAETAQWAKENPVIGSAASVGTSVLSGADYLSKAIETATVGQPVASSTPGLSEITHAIRGGVSEDMSDTGKFFYNTAMSGIDSLVAGLGGSGGAVLLGLGAASSTYNDIKERGGSEKQALVGGAVSGIFESLFEKVSIGNFSALKEMPVDSLKTLFKNYAKSAGVNFTEEALTEVANIAYDYFAMGDLSHYELMARSLEEQYLAQGMSASEAKKKAEQDAQLAFLKQVGEAGLSGALMSFGFTTVGAAASEYNAYKTGQGYADNGAQRDLVQLALQGDKNSQSYKMAENIAAKLDANEDATVGSREIGRLANMMGYEAAKAAEDAEKAERRERLKTTVMGLGFGTGSSAIAKASEYSANNKTYNINDTKSLINYAMSFPSDTASYQMGEQLKGKKDITSAEEGALIRTISQDIEQGNHKANPAAETISLGGNENGQVTAEIAPVASQAVQEGTSSAALADVPQIQQRAANTQLAPQDIFRRGYEAQLRAKQNNPVEMPAGADYTVNNNKESVSDGNEVHLRESGERLDGADPAGSVSAVAGNAEQNQSRTAQRGSADGEISRVSYGEEVSTAQLGIEGGSSQDSVYLVDSNSTAATRAAQAVADERGMELVLFAGGDIHTADAPDGARGFTDGKRIFARVDDPDFTSEQIARHEVGHDMLDRGEIDPNQVRERIAELVGSENVETAAKLYAMAYAGSGLSADEVWAECICDSLGGMNIFSGSGSDVETFMEGFVDAARQETEASRQVPRGPPEVGKSQYSRRIGGDKYADQGSEETRRAAFTGDGALRWESGRNGHRRAEESRESFLGRMGQSRSSLRSFGEILYGYRTVSVTVASEYAKEAAAEFERFGIKDYFIFDGEVQANDTVSTFGDSSDGLTLKDGFIGINNNAADAPETLTPKNVAAHEAIHHKLDNKDSATEAYEQTVIENLLIDSDLFRVYSDAIIESYFDNNLDLRNEAHIERFFEEFSAFVSGHIYGEIMDVSEMFADYDAVCSALESALGVKLPGHNSQRLGTEELVQEIERIRKEGRQQGRSEEDVIEDIRAAVDEVYQGMIEDFGAIEPGEKPYREVKVPKRSLKDNKVSQTVRTILEAQATPDEVLPDIEELVTRGDFSYDVYSDKAAIADARDKLEKNWNEELSRWYARMDRGEVSKANTAMGWALYNNAVNRGDTDMALTILDKIVKHQRNAAQAVQATRILKKLTPETQLYQIQKTVEGLQQDLFDRYGEEKSPTLKIDPELAEQFLRAETQEERDTVTRKIYQKVGQQMPSTFRDKWNAWRYLAMLGNPRTHVRNIIGNAGFVPVVAAKNLTATAIENVVSRVSGGKLQRTKSMVGLSAKDRGLLKAAWADYAVVEDAISSGKKYDDLSNTNKLIAEGQEIFKFKPLEKFRKGNSSLLEMEDVWFSRPHYAAALASYCKTNKISAEDIASGKDIGAARTYAVREAQKATYKDTNALSWLLSRKFQETGEFGKKIGKGANVFMEGVLPFRKTPANILARGLEYSPVGLLNGIKQAVWDVSKGTKTGAEAIDSISAGLTGTGLLALGMYLAAEGLVRGAGGGDDKEKKFDELMGHQTYSLEVGGQSWTLDWLAPEALPFFVGVNVWEQMSEREEKVLTLKDLLEATTNLSEPLLEMSCLQSLNDMLDAVGYAQSNGMNGLGTIITNVATSYITQAFPTLFGQIERVTEEERETTYTEKASFLTNDLQYLFGKIGNKLPGEFQQIPYIDAWGRTESTGSVGERIFGNMINPAYTSEINTSPMEEELIRLYEATGENVFPDRADKYFNVDKVRKDLTAEEYVTYATARGQNSRKILTALTSSSEYKKLGDADKAAVVELAYDLANAQAKMKVSDYEPDGWVAKALQCMKDTNVSPELYIICYQAQKEIKSLKDKDGDTIANSKGLLIMQAINKVGGLTFKQKQAMYAAFGVGSKILMYTPKQVDDALAKMRKE